MSRTDEALARAAQEGDRQALSSLYRRYLDQVYRFLYVRLGNRPQTEDLTAEVFRRLLDSLPQYDPHKGAFRGWLYGLARHVLADFWRHAYRVQEVPLEEFLDLDGREPLSDDLSHTQRRARQLLASLPDAYRQVLELRILQGRSVAETAEIMKISANYVKVLQYRALKKAAALAPQVVDQERGDRDESH